MAYDRLGSDWKANQEFRPPPDWNTGFEFSERGFGGADASQYSDFFESLFGQGFGAGQGRQGRHGGTPADAPARFMRQARIIMPR